MMLYSAPCTRRVNFFQMTKYPRHTKKWNCQENGLIYTIPTTHHSQGWAKGYPVTHAMFCPISWRTVNVGGLQCIEFLREKCDVWAKKSIFFIGSFSLKKDLRYFEFWNQNWASFFLSQFLFNFFSRWVFSKVNKKACSSLSLRGSFAF